MSSLRYRILLTLFPLLLLLGILGGTAAALLSELSGRIDAILRENYDSVIYMEGLREALERIDSSFSFALAGEETLARPQYAEFWPRYLENLRREQHNITLLGEEEEVARLTTLTESYRLKGDAFYKQSPGDPQRKVDYFGPDGLLDAFKTIKDCSGRIMRLNQENMEQASTQARRIARNSLVGFGIALAASAVLVIVLTWQIVRTILRPIQAMTDSALAIGGGDLDQIVAVSSDDELGRLAGAFNRMARQLRQFRQSSLAQLFRAQQTSRATIDAFPDPVLVVDPEGLVEMANPAAQKLFGAVDRHDGQVGGTPWQPPAALTETLREALHAQRAYMPDDFERALPLHIEGQERSFLPRILPIRDPYGQTLGAAVMFQNVTRFRLLDQVKSDLVATASHELKTPLTSVRLAVHLLLEEAVGPLNAKQTELLVDARDNAERLLAMVNNLLDLARLEQGRQHLALHPERPEDLLRAAVETVRHRAQDKGVSLDVEADPDLPNVLVDRVQLGHALNNLLDNAIKYTEANGRISLAAQRQGSEIVLSVKDSGLGIPPAHLPHIFDRFFRVPGRERGGGTGLGLAIVREIAQAHSGAVTCESTPGNGTVFRVTLPLRGPDTSAQENPLGS